MYCTKNGHVAENCDERKFMCRWLYEKHFVSYPIDVNDPFALVLDLPTYFEANLLYPRDDPRHVDYREYVMTHRNRGLDPNVQTDPEDDVPYFDRGNAISQPKRETKSSTTKIEQPTESESDWSDYPIRKSYAPKPVQIVGYDNIGASTSSGVAAPNNFVPYAVPNYLLDPSREQTSDSSDDDSPKLIIDSTAIKNVDEPSCSNTGQIIANIDEKYRVKKRSASCRSFRRSNEFDRFYLSEEEFTGPKVSKPYEPSTPFTVWQNRRKSST